MSKQFRIAANPKAENYESPEVEARNTKLGFESRYIQVDVELLAGAEDKVHDYCFNRSEGREETDRAAWCSFLSETGRWLTGLVTWNRDEQNGLYFKLWQLKSRCRPARRTSSKPRNLVAA